MTDLNSLAISALDLFRDHSPWLAEKLGAAVVSQTVKEAWDRLKTKLASHGGQEAVSKVESAPEKDRNWDMLRNHLLDVLEEDSAFRDRLQSVVSTQPVQQNIQGSGNKQAAIIGSPGGTIHQQ